MWPGKKPLRVLKTRYDELGGKLFGAPVLLNGTMFSQISINYCYVYILCNNAALR